jgi:hypothetical protein
MARVMLRLGNTHAMAGLRFRGHRCQHRVTFKDQHRLRPPDLWDFDFGKRGKGTSLKIEGLEAICVALVLSGSFSPGRP